MFTRRALVVALSLMVTHVTAAQVSAQDVRRPYRGLFGAPSSSDSPHSLTLTGSVFAAYDDNVVEALSNDSVRAPWLQKSGTYQGANAGLAYAFRLDGERFDFTGRLGTQLNYFRHEDRSGALPAAQADVGFNARLTKSLGFTARQTVGYASAYTSSLAPRPDEDTGHDFAVADDIDLALFAQRSLRSATRVGLSQEFGRYASLGASYYLRSNRVLDSEVPNSPFRDYTTQSGSLGFLYARPMTRNATLRLGYGIRVNDGNSPTGEPDVMHNVNAGVDYSRALSFSRRTSFSFGSGSSIAVSEPISGLDPGNDGGRRTSARLTGHAALMHELGRTWTASLAYTRGFRTRDGFDQLYLTDAVTASIGGLVSRRLSLSGRASWARSTREFGGGNHAGKSASAQATYALGQFLALYASYVYYQYRFDEQIPLDARFPRALDRHGVRVGVSTSIPLIR